MAVVRMVAASATGSAGEIEVRDEIITWGHDCAIIDDADAVPAGVDAFIIMDTCATATLANKYRNIPQYVIYCKPGNWDEQWLCTGAATNPGSRTDFDLLNTSHPIVAGLPDPLTYKSGAAGGQWGIAAAAGSIAPGATALAQRNTTPTGHITAFYLPAGGAYVSGNGNAEGNRGGIGPFIDSPLTTLSADGYQLLRNMLEYGLPSAGPSPFIGFGVPV